MSQEIPQKSTKMEDNVYRGDIQPNNVYNTAAQPGGTFGGAVQPNYGYGGTVLPAVGNPTIAPSEIPPPNPILSALITAISDVEGIIDNLQTKLDIDSDMTGRERLRLFGVKSRNYGFISKAFDIARDNPNFAPPNFDMNAMMKNLVYLEHARQLTMLLEQLRQLADDFLLTTCDIAYRDALRIYGNLREQSRAHVAGAKALFDELLQYFTLRRRRPDEAEPTEHELELDFKRLIHGKADGEMVIKNESPHVSSGVHEVVDDVHKAQRAEIKVNAERRE